MSAWFPLTPLLTLLLCAGLAAPAAAQDFVRPSDELLLVAAQAGMEELVVNRLRGGANVDSTDHRARTALMLAARHNNLETVRRLLENGADTEKVDHDGLTAAMWAARTGHVTVLHTILEHLEGTPALERQARLSLGVIQRVGDRQTERALRERYPDALSRGGAPAPARTVPRLPPTTPAWGGGASTPWGGGETGQPPPQPVATPPAAQPMMVAPAPGWPFAPPTAPKNNPLSELPPIPTPPPERAPAP